MPQRFDARLMIWQQRNKTTVHLQPSTLVRETHLLQARAPSSTGGRRAGSAHASSLECRQASLEEVFPGPAARRHLAAVEPRRAE